jgi:dihydroorotate dehydrogenase
VLTSLAKPAVRLLGRLGPERAHAVTIWALEHGLAPSMVGEGDDPILSTTLWGLSLPNPIGLAAGFDKDARVFTPALRLGFGFVEVGTVTPRPQTGNPRPRVFRLPEDSAVINRLGFNSGGMEAAVRRLAVGHQGIVGANIGMNRDSLNPVDDYATAARRVAPLVDYIAVNISSPNTPGLRALQERDALADVIEGVVRASADAVPDHPIPIAIKIAPDLSSDDLRSIVDVALHGGVVGLIVGNTTTERPASLRGRHRKETGGLSGRPLFRASTELLRNAYLMSSGRLSLVGTGGIENGMDAYAKIRAGASAVQLYSALIYGGPALVGKIKRELAACLRSDGCGCVADAIGADHR